jgi:hypothetical protein
MKRSSNTNKWLALIAILIISLGYCTLRGSVKEGIQNKRCPTWQELDEDGDCVNKKKE